MTGGSVLKKFHTGKRILTLFMPGFLFGIIYTNFIARQYVAEPEVFSDYFTAVFTDQDRCTGIYLVCFKGKSDSVCSSSWAGIYENEKNDCIAFAIWTGISGGILLSIAVTELGIRGSIFCLLGIFPQFLFIFLLF